MTESKLADAQVCELGEKTDWEKTLCQKTDTKKLLGGDENVLYVGCAGSCTGTYFCQNSLNITFKNGHILLQMINDTSFHQGK